MYTDSDLEHAVEKGIFKASAVELFREDILKRSNKNFADEEDFKLVSSFNDIFVLIACALLLLSTAWVLNETSEVLSSLVVTATSWALAEFFVLKRKMALPGIALLLTFVGGVFASIFFVFDNHYSNETVFMLAALLSSLGAWLHWRRFKVPITIAAGAAAAVIFVVSLLVSVFPVLKDGVEILMFFGGLVVFYVAMRWDMADVKRVSGKSDVAFWLHLTAAPLIVHPVFFSLGIFDGDQSALSLAFVLILYLVLIVVSLVIDRRAFMVSSLVYVLTALVQLFKIYGLAGDSFAYVGVVIGLSLLLLSGYWNKARAAVVSLLPASIHLKVPSILN